MPSENKLFQINLLYFLILIGDYLSEQEVRDLKNLAFSLFLPLQSMLGILEKKLCLKSEISHLCEEKVALVHRGHKGQIRWDPPHPL